MYVTAQKLWPELGRRSLSGLLRRGASAQNAAALASALDTGLLQQLGPIAAVHPYRLEAQACPHKASCLVDL
jgi:hypothetical protein